VAAPFALVDVFADEPLFCNPLAVVPDADQPGTRGSTAADGGTVIRGILALTSRRFDREHRIAFRHVAAARIGR
jgi:hypothetical protein